MPIEAKGEEYVAVDGVDRASLDRKLLWWGGDGGNDSSLGKEQFGGNDSVGGISTGGMFNTVEYDNGTRFNIYALFLLSTFISHAHYISHYETSCLVF